MKCKQKTNTHNQTRTDCGEFLYTDKKLNYEKAVKFCKNRKYELAKVKNDYGLLEDKDLEKVRDDFEHLYYRLGLKFERKNGVLIGKWSNGEVYGPISNGKNKTNFDYEDIYNCYEAFLVSNEEKIFLFLCKSKRKERPLCRKPRKKSITINSSLLSSTTTTTKFVRSTTSIVSKNVTSLPTTTKTSPINLVQNEMKPLQQTSSSIKQPTKIPEETKLFSQPTL